jgi:hypothetical protein
VTDDFEKLFEYVRTSRKDDCEAIMCHQNAPKLILIEFTFDGAIGKGQHRLYEVRRSHAGAYSSRSSGGQENFTTESQGPEGEPIEYYREWVVSESGGYIGSFRCLRDLVVMILHQLRGRDVFVCSDSPVLVVS